VGLRLAKSSVVPRIYDAVDRLEVAMSYHRERHGVLASNVSHVETPGYRPLDLQRTAAPEGLRPWLAENPQAAGPTHGETWSVFDAGGALAGPDGNAVQLERELSKIDANRVRYGTSAELVSRRMALLRYAAGDGNS
jgi:flagellar basal-body rod protein FlgB